MSTLKRYLHQLGDYPSALLGLLMIGALIVMSFVVPLLIPYEEAVRLWRGGEDIWAEYPRNAWPVWYNWFVDGSLPETIRFRSADGDGTPVVEQLSEGTT
ncbi:MAG: hypothetical protein P8169_11485, partial [Chloroflexota bacterium]